MSFSRAKISRFNEKKADVPSPTRYDPKLGDKTKGGIICKERERTTSASDTASTGGTPFRTPYSVVKKHSCFASGEKPVVARGMNFGEGVAPLTHQNEEEHLRHEISELEKIVERISEKLKETETEKDHFELQVAALEAAKADLECVVSNNQNCEKQVQELTEQIERLRTQLETLESEKKDLLVKLAEEEQRSGKLEDRNDECGRRILCLEGTLEEVKSEYIRKVQEVHILQETGDKLKISIECLQGKVSTLENELSKLEAERATNEAAIFGLEQRASLLNNSLEAARSEIESHKEIVLKLSAQLDEQQKACSLHDDTIQGLDMQLEVKQEELGKLTAESKEKIACLDNEIADLKKTVASLEEAKKESETQLTESLNEKDDKLKNLLETNEMQIKEHESKIAQLTNEKETVIAELNKKLAEKEEEIIKLKEEKNKIIKSHEEEIFHLNDEWEKKIFAQMQDSEQAILEKEAIIKLGELQHAKMLAEAKEEWERQLRDAEEEACRRQSAQLEAGEMLKAKYEDKLSNLEKRLEHVLEAKAHEAAIASERYRDVCEELNALTKFVQEKEAEIVTINDKSSNRLNNLLEEVKILSAEINEKTKQLDEMTAKFKDEWKKNEKLSEQLGELDSKVSAVEEELKSRAADKEKISAELKKARHEYNDLKLKNLDLQLNLATHQDNNMQLTTELDNARTTFNSQLLELSTELSSVKRQCRKFEIAMADTRKSLEALGQRLIESENEVERLNHENEMMQTKLATAENEKNDADNKYRHLVDLKMDLEKQILVAEETEKILRGKVEELERNNCELELKWNDIVILKDTLEDDKKNYEAALANLKNVANEQNLKLVQMERESLEQVEAVSQLLMGKLDEFAKSSTENIQILNAEIRRVQCEKEAAIAEYKAKCEEYENLFTDHDILKTTFDIATKESQTVKKQCEKQEVELKSALEKLTLADVEKTELTNKLETSNMASENLARELEEKIGELSNLNEMNGQHEARIAELEIEVSKKSSAVENLNSEMEQLKISFEEQIANLRKSKNEEIEKILLEREEYKEQMMKSTDKVVDLHHEIESEREEAEALRQANKQYTESMYKLQDEVSFLKSEHDETKKTNTELSNQLEEVKTEVSRLHEVQSVAQKMAEEKISELERELEKAKSGGDWKVKWESLLKEKESLSSELLGMTEKKDMYKSYCRKFEEQLQEAQADRDTAVKDFDEIHGLLKSKDAEVGKLQKMINDYESLIGPFREQLEQYETERLVLENDREQLRRQHLEQAAKLGHQNHKQKIQHVVRLKQDILELRNENKKLQCEVKTKNKVIESLREEVGQHPKRLFINGKRPTSTPFKGKENDERGSPIHVKQEPMSPFKERNC